MTSYAVSVTIVEDVKVVSATIPAFVPTLGALDTINYSIR
jgi:hypothetical protein